jgi:hypothetical protein
MQHCLYIMRLPTSLSVLLLHLCSRSSSLLCFALSLSSFPLQVVGAKSKNLAGLRGKLPDWIGLPSSITVRA